MIDIHSHLIYSVDDGSPTIKESIRMVLEAEKAGIKAIVATPHFHENIYPTEKVIKNFDELKDRVADCGIDLYIGCEAFITPYLPELLKKKSLLSLAGSRYVLFELPADSIPVYSNEVVYKMNIHDNVPIIAHPERNRNFVKNFNSFLNFIERGCLIQIDAASIVGVYGMEVKNFAKKIIKLKMAHFAASDAHCADDYVRWYTGSYEKVCSWSSEEYADMIFNKNPGKILSNARWDSL
jgi:protein-tyrosine phosphatase